MAMEPFEMHRYEVTMDGQTVVFWKIVRPQAPAGAQKEIIVWNIDEFISWRQIMLPQPLIDMTIANMLLKRHGVKIVGQNPFGEDGPFNSRNFPAWLNQQKDERYDGPDLSFL